MKHYYYLGLITIILACSGKNKITEQKVDTVQSIQEIEPEKMSLKKDGVVVDDSVKVIDLQEKIKEEEKRNSIPAAIPLKPAPSAKEPKKGISPKNSVTKEDKTKDEIEKPLEPEPEKITVTEPNHQPFNDLLQIYVSESGKVDYAGFKNDKSKLKLYIENLEKSPPVKTWDRNSQLAYWINLYNALTINLILDYYPLKSIQDINKGKPWDLKLTKVNGVNYSLNEIENTIIRPEFNEPRIHFAVNCAAKSCPKLLNKAYFPQTLNTQLDKQTQYFVSNKSKNIITKNKLEISKIFDWYAKDFGDVKAYLAKYHQDINQELKVSYAEYDWSLNN